MAFFNESMSKTESAPFFREITDKSGADISLRFGNDVSLYVSEVDKFNIFVLTGGAVNYSQGQEKLLLKTRTVGVFFPGDNPVFSSVPDTKNQYLHISISSRTFIEFCDLVDRETYNLIISNSQACFFRLMVREFEHFMFLADNIVFSDTKSTLLLARRMIFSLLSQLVASSEKHLEYPEWFEIFLDKIRGPKYFLMPISDIYKLAPYSQPMLNSYFNKYMGETLVSYITKLKINYACNLLCFFDYSVVDIVAKTRYSSVSHFNYIFKKHTGMTPSEYRAHYGEISIK